MQAPPIGQEQTEQIFDWLATIAFSRSPKNIARDFSDGVLMAQVMRHHYPNLVQLHNYQPTNSSASKYINWKTLNEKIFRKLGFQVSRSDVENIIISTPGIIERVLHLVYTKILQNQQSTQNRTVSLANKLSQMSNPNPTSPIMKRNSSKEEENKNSFAKELSTQLADKEMVIRELRETIEILETKMKKMEQLSKLKDAKIDSLMKKLDEGIGL